MAFLASIGRPLNWISCAILALFAGAWVAMILLTRDPSSEWLWMVNINAARLFGDAFYIVQDTLGFSVVSCAIAFSAMAVATAFASRRGAGVRFLSAHLAMAMVSIPVLRSAVAAGGADFGYLVGSPGRAWFDITAIDAIRLPLMAMALLAVLAAHLELVSRIRRESAVRGRARRLLSVR